MNRLLKLFWRICLFKAGPDQLPVTRDFLWLFIVVYWLIDATIQLSISPSSGLLTYPINLVMLGVFLGVMWALLRLKSMTARLPQSVMAWLATDLIIMLIILPFLLLFLPELNAMLVSRAMPELSAWFWPVFVVQCWGLGVKGFILHRTLEISIFQGVCLALVVSIVC